MTYARLMECIEAFARGTMDEAMWAELQAATFDWQGGVIQRVARHLHDAIQSRLSAAQDALQRDLDRSRSRPPAVTRALLDGRRHLMTIACFLRLPLWHDHLRLPLTELVVKTGEEIQSRLEESAQKQRDARVLALLRGTPVWRASLSEDPCAAVTGVSQPSPRGRRVLYG